MVGGFFRAVCLAGCLGCWGALVLAQEAEEAAPVNGIEVPFTALVPVDVLDQQAKAFWFAGSAKRALGTGLYSISYSLAVEAERMLGQVRDFENDLVIIDSLLALSSWAEARTRLTALAGVRGVSRQRLDLRWAMIAYRERDLEGLVSRLEGIVVTSLATGDAAWYWFLSGWNELQSGNMDASRSMFDSARRVGAGTSPALASQIGYLIFRSLLESRTASAETVPQLQNALLEYAGKEVSYLYAQQLAVLLFDQGKREEAIQIIVRNLETIPVGLAREKAQFQLLATMAAGLDRAEGRQALSELISANRFPELMGIALQQAFYRARLGDGGGKEVIRATLDRIISAPTDHALLDQALYYRAVFRYIDEEYVLAEDDAAELQRRFPSSTYRRGMLALQASCAWSRKRYRTAASRLQQMRSDFSDLAEVSRLSALIADCSLRAGLQSNTREDFRNAAEAYATALSNVKTTVLSNAEKAVEGGPLFFQLVYSRLRAGQLDLALEAIDDPRLRELAGNEMIWRTQWMALREMRRVDRGTEAYERAQVAVMEEASNPFLKLRLLWLTARLSVFSGDPESTIEWVGQIEAFVQSSDLADADQNLLNKVLASSLLTLSEAHFLLDESGEAVDLLQRLRKDYPGSESAIWSYILEARFLSNSNKTVDAQRLLVSLADQYKDHRLAPIALFEAALNAAQRGQDAYLDEAIQLLQRIADDYPKAEILYRARLMQADLLRRLNKFGFAEQIYEFLENEYSDRPDRFLAQMSLADTLLAQADQDSRKFDAAISKLELLMDLPATLPDAPLDLRVEAGYKLAQALRSRGETLKAKQIYWSLYDQTLVEEPRILSLTRNGRYWLSRCIFALAEISNDLGEVDQAVMYYRQIMDRRLPGGVIARDRLEALVRPAAAAVTN